MGNDIVASIKAKFILKNLSINPKDYIENYDQISEHFKISENESSNKKEKKEQKNNEAEALAVDNIDKSDTLGKRVREPEDQQKVADALAHQDDNQFKIVSNNLKRQRVQANKNPTTTLVGATSQVSFGK